ncbi:cytochrome P450 [uncultured Sphingomonas sp.]|uniref:cytochrome P450 n=1 Tax=uncultured Sphingomonas sp. TaxID=158754 RepID=UPI0025FCA96A|nr:cytochrome P450 [uncultured Sphingomonas sp.]
MNAISRIQDFNDPHYNPFTAMKDAGEGSIGNFYPELKRLRDQSPVFDGDLRKHFGLHGDITMSHLRHVAVLGYKEIKDVLLSTKIYSNAVYQHNLGVFFGESVTVMDNPDHAKFRHLFQKAFMPKMINGWGEEIIPRMINDLIDGFEGRGRAELISEFTLHFPFHFIHELMGLPIEDREIFHKLAFGQIAITFDTEHGMDATTKLKDYLTVVVQDRRDNPREGDFMSTIATAEVDGERLPENVVISFFRQLMNAGGDTSFNGFSSVLTALLTHPDQFEQVKADRTLVPKAIEEGLRWNCPVPGVSRTPVETVELGGVTINPGDHMLVFLASANRDEKVFERPDEFDISRATRNHAAFGYGPHICIGQHLARLEMVNALNALLDRLPRLRLDPDFPPPEVCGMALRGPQAIHVRFD